MGMQGRSETSTGHEQDKVEGKTQKTRAGGTESIQSQSACEYQKKPTQHTHRKQESGKKKKRKREKREKNTEMHKRNIGAHPNEREKKDMCTRHRADKQAGSSQPLLAQK